jgi:hypothetical protein
LVARSTLSDLSPLASGAPSRVTPTVSDPRRNAVAFTAIDGNLRLHLQVLLAEVAVAI